MRFAKAVVGVTAGFLLLGSGVPSQAVEIGDDDFRISNVDDVVSIGRSENPAIAFNSQDNEFLVVWEDSGQLASDQEIFGQRVDAVTGDLIEGVVQISNMGGNGATAAQAGNPFTVYNSTNNEYLVVWAGDDGRNGLTDNENEIFGQRLSAGGDAVGDDDFRISDMGTLGDANFDASFPRGVYNPERNEYVVIWTGDDVTDNDVNVFGQRINAETGAQLADDFLISDEDRSNGNIVFNSTDDEYLVVFNGGVDTEIFAQRLDELGAKVGDEISIGDKRELDQNPSSVYNPLGNEYLVVWEARNNATGFEIFGQRLNASGDPIGDDDFQISNSGPDANDGFEADAPAPVYVSANDEYLVLWEGDPSVSPLVDDEFEIFGQRLDASSGTAIGDDFRVSSAGTDGDDLVGAFIPAPAYDPVRNATLVAWRANDGADSRREIFGQFLRDAQCGNGVVESEGSETCDDGNLTAGDGCDASCLIEEDDGGGDDDGDNGGGGCSLIR